MGTRSGLIHSAALGGQPAASSEDAATTAWVNAVVADGGAVSATQRTRVNTLITALKGASAWTSLVRLWLYGGESDAHQAKIDIANLGTHTIGGTISLAAGGYTSAGANGYLNTGYNPNTASLPANTAAMGIYICTEENSGNNWIPFGQVGAGGGNYTLLSLSASLGNIFFEMGEGSFNSHANTPATTKGQWVVWSSDATHQGCDRNESALFTDAKASSSFESANVYVNTNNGNGTPSGTNYGNGQMAAFWVTSDSTKRTSIANAVNAYMTAWGINVY